MILVLVLSSVLCGLVTEADEVFEGVVLGMCHLANCNEGRLPVAKLQDGIPL